MLVSHSQGSYILAALIRQEIDGKPVQARMVSAILRATLAPRGKDVGGAFQHVPLCRAASQSGAYRLFFVPVHHSAAGQYAIRKSPRGQDGRGLY